MACAWIFSAKELKELMRQEFLSNFGPDSVMILVAGNLCNYWGAISNQRHNKDLDNIDYIERVSNPRETIDWTHVDWIWLRDNARNGLLRRPDLGKIPDWLESVYPTIISVGVDRWSILEE